MNILSLYVNNNELISNKNFVVENIELRNEINTTTNEKIFTSGSNLIKNKVSYKILKVSGKMFAKDIVELQDIEDYFLKTFVIRDRFELMIKTTEEAKKKNGSETNEYLPAYGQFRKGIAICTSTQPIKKEPYMINIQNFELEYLILSDMHSRIEVTEIHQNLLNGGVSIPLTNLKGTADCYGYYEIFFGSNATKMKFSIGKTYVEIEKTIDTNERIIIDGYQGVVVNNNGLRIAYKGIIPMLSFGKSINIITDATSFDVIYKYYPTYK